MHNKHEWFWLAERPVCNDVFDIQNQQDQYGYCCYVLEVTNFSTPNPFLFILIWMTVILRSECMFSTSTVDQNHTYHTVYIYVRYTVHHCPPHCNRHLSSVNFNPSFFYHPFGLLLSFGPKFVFVFQYRFWLTQKNYSPVLVSKHSKKIFYSSRTAGEKRSDSWEAYE